jgi:hypothetical protein
MMNETKITAPLLAFLASGGTIERVLAELPMFKTQIELALDGMKSQARCTAAEIEKRAIRLREVVVQKERAIRSKDFDTAAGLRAQECAIYEAFGLDRRTGVNASLVAYVPIEGQIQLLFKLLNEVHKPDA